MNKNVYYQIKKLTIGNVYLYADDSSLIALDFAINPKYKNAIQSNKHPILNQAFLELEEYLKGERYKFEVKLNPSGTEFQQLAWKTLAKIPWGKVMSYGDQSKKMNRPNAQRATGSANGKNPLPIIIPCHRIITADNKLGGYSGDIKLKIKLLEIEGHQVIDGRVIK
jgi:methylated-DNA-[protein]-cysteine S-methyltransferase